MAALNEVIAANVRRYRTLSGRSKTWLAEQLGVSQSTVGAIERGSQNINANQIEALAKAFSKTPADLITEPERCPTCGQYVPAGDEPEPEPEECESCGHIRERHAGGDGACGGRFGTLCPCVGFVGSGS